MKEYIIKAGHHYSGIHFSLTDRDIKGFLKIDESMKYSLPAAQNGVSKIIGFSDGYHKWNSCRLGWMCVEGQIQLFMYCYIRGERHIEYLKNVEPKQLVTFALKRIRNEYIVQVDSTVKSVKAGPKCLSYMLYPYVGGTYTLAHDVKILMEVFNK